MNTLSRMLVRLSIGIACATSSIPFYHSINTCVPPYENDYYGNLQSRESERDSVHIHAYTASFPFSKGEDSP